MMKQTLLALFIAVTCLAAKAQDDNLAYKSDYGKTSAKNGGGSFFDNNIKFSIPLKNGFSYGPEAGILNIGSTSSLADVSSLITLGLSFGYHHKVGETTLFTAHVEPLLASDFQGLISNAFRFKSDGLFLFNTNRKFAFGFGLGYQYQFSGSQLMPLAITVWRISDHVTLTGILPIIPRLEFKLNDKWSIGGGINGDYSSYRLGGFDNRYIQYRNWSFGLTGKYRPSKQIEVGALLGIGTRKLEIFKSDQTVPLRIYGWDIGGGSHVADFTQSYKGVALNFSLAYKI